MSDPRIRPAGASDAAVLVELVISLADYEKLPRPDSAACERLTRDGFGAAPRFRVLLGHAEDRAVGYALFFETYSSFLARPTLYLEDIFVLPAYRGTGLGAALFRAVAAEAVERGCGRMEWAVLTWNQLAIDFYDRLGAETMHDWRTHRLAGSMLAAVAQR